MCASHEWLHVACAGGGTGGHLYPMLSLVEALRAVDSKARFSFFTTTRAIDGRLIGRVLDEEGDRVVVQTVRPVPGSVTGAWGFWREWRASVQQCLRAFGAYRPDVVIGSGGYGSAPAIVAARKMGIACVLLNPDAVPGKANRYLASKADIVFAQWGVTERSFPRSARVLSLGCPIRAAFLSADRSEGIERFGLDESRRTLLVTGASQGAHSINRAMALVAGELSAIAGWQVLHLAGRNEVGIVRSAYSSRKLSARVLDYTEHMPSALGVADLVVSRAGASTLAEITALGVPSVILPYPYHRDRHQYANARVLTEAGAALMVEDAVEPEKTGPRLLGALMGLMGDADALSEMSVHARSLASPNAAKEITRLVLALIGRDRGGGSDSTNGLDESGDWRENGARDDEGNEAESSVDAAAWSYLVRSDS